MTSHVEATNTLSAVGTVIDSKVNVEGTSSNTPNNIVDDGTETTVVTTRSVESFATSSESSGELLWIQTMTPTALSLKDVRLEANFKSHEKWRVKDYIVSMTNAEKFSTAGGVCKLTTYHDAASNVPDSGQALKDFIASSPLSRNISARASGEGLSFGTITSDHSWKFTNDFHGRDPNLYSYPSLLFALITPGSAPQVTFQLDIVSKIEFSCPLKQVEELNEDRAFANLIYSSIDIHIDPYHHGTITAHISDESFTIPPVTGKIHPFNYENHTFDCEDFGQVQVNFGIGDFNHAAKTVTYPFTDVDFTAEGESPDFTKTIHHQVNGIVVFKTSLSRASQNFMSKGYEQDAESAVKFIKQSISKFSPSEIAAMTAFFNRTMKSKKIKRFFHA